jgi:hypothetical protein
MKINTDNKAESYLNVGWMGEGWKKSGRRVEEEHSWVGSKKPRKSLKTARIALSKKQLI